MDKITVVLPRVEEFNQTIGPGQRVEEQSVKLGQRQRKGSLAKGKTQTNSDAPGGAESTELVVPLAKGGIQGARLVLPAIQDEEGAEEKEDGQASDRVPGLSLPEVLKLQTKRNRRQDPSSLQLEIAGQDLQVPTQISKNSKLTKTSDDLFVSYRTARQDYKEKLTQSQKKPPERSFGALKHILKCHATGIPIEIYGQKKVRKRCARPIFHCRRCLVNWEQMGKVPKDCREPEDLVRGPAIDLTVNAANFLQNVWACHLAEKNENPVDIDLPEWRCDLKKLMTAKKRVEIKSEDEYDEEYDEEEFTSSDDEADAFTDTSLRKQVHIKSVKKREGEARGLDYTSLSDSFMSESDSDEETASIKTQQRESRRARTKRHGVKKYDSKSFTDSDHASVTFDESAKPKMKFRVNIRETYRYKSKGSTLSSDSISSSCDTVSVTSSNTGQTARTKNITNFKSKKPKEYESKSKTRVQRSKNVSDSWSDKSFSERTDSNMSYGPKDEPQPSSRNRHANNGLHGKNPGSCNSFAGSEGSTSYLPRKNSERISKRPKRLRHKTKTVQKTAGKKRPVETHTVVQQPKPKLTPEMMDILIEASLMKPGHKEKLGKCHDNEPMEAPDECIITNAMIKVLIKVGKIRCKEDLLQDNFRMDDDGVSGDEAKSKYIPTTRQKRARTKKRKTKKAIPEKVESSDDDDGEKFLLPGKLTINDKGSSYDDLLQDILDTYEHEEQLPDMDLLNHINNSNEILIKSHYFGDDDFDFSYLSDEDSKWFIHGKDSLSPGYHNDDTDSRSSFGSDISPRTSSPGYNTFDRQSKDEADVIKQPAKPKLRKPKEKPVMPNPLAKNRTGKPDTIAGRLESKVFNTPKNGSNISGQSGHLTTVSTYNGDGRRNSYMTRGTIDGSQTQAVGGNDTAVVEEQVTMSVKAPKFKTPKALLKKPTKEVAKRPTNAYNSRQIDMTNVDDFTNEGAQIDGDYSNQGSQLFGGPTRFGSMTAQNTIGQPRRPSALQFKYGNNAPNPASRPTTATGTFLKARNSTTATADQFSTRRSSATVNRSPSRRVQLPRKDQVDEPECGIEMTVEKRPIAKVAPYNDTRMSSLTVNANSNSSSASSSLSTISSSSTSSESEVSPISSDTMLKEKQKMLSKEPGAVSILSFTPAFTFSIFATLQNQKKKPQKPQKSAKKRATKKKKKTSKAPPTNQAAAPEPEKKQEKAKPNTEVAKLSRKINRRLSNPNPFLKYMKKLEVLEENQPLETNIIQEEEEDLEEDVEASDNAANVDEDNKNHKACQTDDTLTHVVYENTPSENNGDSDESNAVGTQTGLSLIQLSTYHQNPSMTIKVAESVIIRVQDYV